MIMPLLAQAASTAVDPATSLGVTITSLIGSLGAAGAAVAVTYYFLGFLRTDSEKRDRTIQEFREYHSESQKKFQDQLDRLADRGEAAQRSFQEQIARMAETQNALLRDSILTMKSVEKSLENSTETIRGIEKTIASLQFSINGIDGVVRRLGENSGKIRPE